MSSPILISDDDDSFDLEVKQSPELLELELSETFADFMEYKEEDILTPSLTPPPTRTLSQESKKSLAIKKLFSQTKTESSSSLKNRANPAPPGFNRMIGGINVNLPVNPYGCQVALMSKVITGLKKQQNCLLESPTGSGKTLALLCATLAWVKHESKNLEAITPKPVTEAKMSILGGVMKTSKYHDLSPDKCFQKPVFGEKSIYDTPAETSDGDLPNYGDKRDKPLQDSFEDDYVEVTIHKKQRLNSSGGASSSSSTPQKTDSDDNDTPRKSLPTIYYGARTHKQIAQVIKEFERTSYCGEIPMSVLSSREQSCIRELDTAQWKTKNDMCRGCVKVPAKTNAKPEDSLCRFYDNRKVLNHRTLPPAFDVEDLVKAGTELSACPYYAARLMTQEAHIVFCPYNYLIDRGIRSSLCINLTGEIVIIDEAHNIEDVCREAASFTITQQQIQAALDNLQKIMSYRYENSSATEYVEKLIKILKEWEDWFINNRRMVESLLLHRQGEPYPFNTEHFAKSLFNHNIGYAQYPEFKHNATQFCQRVRDEPKAFLFVTQETTMLLETMDAALGYLFRCDCKYLNDYKPILEIVSTRIPPHLMKSVSLRGNIMQTVTLRLVCLNPAVVFSELAGARSVILASGTLAPLDSFQSELGTSFPIIISPNHVVPKERVWVGSLGTTINGNELTCTARTLSQVDVLDSIGQTICRVCEVVPNGVLCFLSSYSLMDQLIARWQITGLWNEINSLKHIFKESKTTKLHHKAMEVFYKESADEKGALLFAVYRGKVSEGMDFKDHQARAVIAVGVPYPNFGDKAVIAKKEYNDRYKDERNLVSGDKWYTIQAYRALNQAVGRCVRHRRDWGAVLLLDQRFSRHDHVQNLSKWVRNFLEGNHYDNFESLFKGPRGLETFIHQMSLQDSQEREHADRTPSQPS